MNHARRRRASRILSRRLLPPAQLTRLLRTQRVSHARRRRASRIPSRRLLPPAQLTRLLRTQRVSRPRHPRASRTTVTITSLRWQPRRVSRTPPSHRTVCTRVRLTRARLISLTPPKASHATRHLRARSPLKLPRRWVARPQSVQVKSRSVVASTGFR